ncbi:hypothetical protein H2200_009757 [Cladophialophora chaetospira]|uniref:DUF4484 domain-containing protein n=1 Tax=Cladophialophora chaetospira TaxID=386627 RepID=A0AA38X396_9EURO|nr:hypothetical protein H2200_009757 [Cladophialophora chaetospira]
MTDQTVPPLKLDTSGEPIAPPIAAIFLVNFDHRKGYTLTWHRSVDGVQVEGVVECKSLPSGLHNVGEDLVYFIHDEYAGLSAFVNRPDEQSDRAVRMLAIGVLVPLEHGRMGRSWRHAETLKELARAQLESLGNTTALEEYWEKYRLKPEEQPSQVSQDPADDDTSERRNGYTKARAMSSATTFISSHHSLTPHHPALTLIDSIKLFGPLLFPLYRAALLRKRILIVTDAPVEFACNLVYNLSILSSISYSTLPLIPKANSSDAKLRPLFTVGVMDIGQLEQERGTGASQGFVACTTDDVLASKPDLYDVLVLMPKSEADHAATKVFPRIVLSSPELTKAFPKIGIRATQRDCRRFSHLLQGLRHLERDEVAASDEETSSVLSDSSSYTLDKELVEPSSWSRVAYTSLVWWASAGDRRAGFAENEENESETDRALLLGEDGESQIREVAVVALFHRITAAIFQTIADATARTDDSGQSDERYHDDSDDNEVANTVADSRPEETQALVAVKDEQEVAISHEDMVEMGLDSWSVSDRKFVEEMVHLWWGRRSVVRSEVIECCGLRLGF